MINVMNQNKFIHRGMQWLFFKAALMMKYCYVWVICAFYSFQSVCKNIDKNWKVIFNIFHFEKYSNLSRLCYFTHAPWKLCEITRLMIMCFFKLLFFLAQKIGMVVALCDLSKNKKLMRIQRLLEWRLKYLEDTCSIELVQKIIYSPN